MLSVKLLIQLFERYKVLRDGAVNTGRVLIRLEDNDKYVRSGALKVLGVKLDKWF